MGDLCRHFGNHSLWKEYDVPKSPIIEVTEIWVDHDGLSSSLVKSRKVSSLDMDDWLLEPPHQHFPEGMFDRSLRLVWVGEDQESGLVSPSTKALEQLTDEWELNDALCYARSCFAGVSALGLRGNSSVFTVTYHPKLAAAWSHSISKLDGLARTNVILFAEGEERAELQRILRSEWARASVSHAMFPALLCGLMLAHGLDTTLEDIKDAVRTVEARTGHHRFASRHQTQPAGGELGSLSAQMSGCAAKLANGTRKMKVVEAINDFIEQHCASGRPPASSSADGPFSQPNISLLRHRVQMQAVDAAYVQQRVQVQIAALFHLIAQQDNAIAFDTASATRSIAASSLQDSSAMKMLALVAMFFLPGSFVAALLSTPLFDWDGARDAERAGSGRGISVGTRPQFALFWVVTCPLTASVLVLYWVWVWRQRRREKDKKKRGGLFLAV
ncbi:hypothetical protein VTK26DRAFT_4706 [Humicola hyalothermophila]